MVNIDVYGLTPNVSILRFVLATIFKNELGKRDSDFDYETESTTKIVSMAMNSVTHLEDLRNNEKEKYYDQLQELNDLCEVMKFRDYFSKLLKLHPEYSDVVLVNKNSHFDEMSGLVSEDLAQVGIRIIDEC